MPLESFISAYRDYNSTFGICISSDKTKKTKKKPAPIHINLTTIHSDNENMDKKQFWGYNG